MKTIAVADILDKRFEPEVGHVVYVVRNGRLLFYIGQSKRDLVVRFREHLQKPSRLGRLINKNKPASLSWSIDFYTLADCRPFVVQKTLFPMQEWEHFDMDMAEEAMIRQLHPVLNSDFNPTPTPLPTHYQGADVFEQPGSPLLTGNGRFDKQSQSPVTATRDRLWLNRMGLQGWSYTQDKKSGSMLWQHASGKWLTEKEGESFRQSGKIPPTQ